MKDTYDADCRSADLMWKTFSRRNELTSTTPPSVYLVGRFIFSINFSVCLLAINVTKSLGHRQVY
jgi:hypothetical protein